MVIKLNFPRHVALKIAQQWELSLIAWEQPDDTVLILGADAEIVRAVAGTTAPLDVAQYASGEKVPALLTTKQAFGPMVDLLTKAGLEVVYLQVTKD